ncbi:MAG: hypothetical protein KZQ56_11555, partial [gamma proteobacterium symbiont of Lucinoma myriamae]|nr:hypothetical protein [gamma proteobacterium symbiont of Lucinoma myriamae]
EGLLGLVASCANLDPYLYKNQALSLITGIDNSRQLQLPPKYGVKERTFFNTPYFILRTYPQFKLMNINLK